MATLNELLIEDINAVINSSIQSGSGAMIGYVIPAAWGIFAVSMLVWSFLVMYGKLESPMQDWLVKAGCFMIIILAAGNLYPDWVVRPLLGLQDQLPQLMVQTPAGTSSTNLIDALDNKITRLVKSCFTTARSLPTNAVGIPDLPSLILLVLSAVLFMLAGAVLEIVALINLIYAKLGLALVLMVGPFFIATLVVNAVKGWFQSWLNTALYFIMLMTLNAAWVAICLSLADRLLRKILEIANIPDTGLGQVAVNLEIIVSLMIASFNFLIIALILAFIGYELRTIASSITGGSGGSAGTGAAALGRAAMNRSNRQKDQALQARQALAAETLAKAAAK